MNKNIFFLTLLLFAGLSFTSQAQDTAGSTNESIFSLGAYGTPTFSYRFKKALEESGNTFVENANRDELPTLLFEVGGRANLKLGKRFRLTTGAMFSQKGYQSKRELRDTITGQIVDHDVRGYTTFNFIEVPVLLSYAISKDSGKSFFLVGGISNGFLIKRTETQPLYNSNEKIIYFPDEDVISEKADFDMRGYNTYQLAFMLGIEGNFMISDKVSLMVQPHYKQFITPTMVKDKGVGKLVQENLYSIGISFGFDYHF